MINWKQFAKIFWNRCRYDSDSWVQGYDQGIQSAQDRIVYLRSVLGEISHCNNGAGYMPELARQALEADEPEC